MNKQVQAFDLKLDVSQGRTSVRLRRGSCVVAQVADVQLWNWNNWFYDPSSMNVVNPDGAIAPVNTIIFAVSDSEETESRSGTRPEGAADLQGQG